MTLSADQRVPKGLYWQSLFFSLKDKSGLEVVGQRPVAVLADEIKQQRIKAPIYVVAWPGQDDNHY